MLDAASDGSDHSTHAEILQAIVGTSIDSAAVRIVKADKGYYVIPIDAPAVAATKSLAAAARGADVGSNSVQSVFGISNPEAAK